MTTCLVHRDSSGRLKRNVENVNKCLYSEHEPVLRMIHRRVITHKRNYDAMCMRLPAYVDESYGLLRTRIHFLLLLVHMNVVLYLSFMSRNS